MVRESEQPENPPAEDGAESAPELEEAAPPTPFDHPLFLPVLLAAGAAWFGYDGWFNPEIEAVLFNRIGFGVLAAAAAYTGFQAKREMDAERDAGSRSPSEE